MIGTNALRKVFLIGNNWSKGYIDKQLVVDYDGGVSAISSLDYDNLSATQSIAVGSKIIRVRHMTDSDEILEDHFLVDSDTTMKSCSKVSRKTLTDNVKNCISHMRNPKFKMFATYLPGECMQRNKYDCNIHRKARFIRPLQDIDPEMYEFIVNELKRSYNSDTPSDWRSTRCKPLPEVLNSKERLVIDSANSDDTVAHTSQHWLLYMQDGSIQWDSEPYPTSGGIVDVVTGKTVKIHTNSPRPIPTGVRRAVKITIGIHHEGEALVGVAWSIFDSGKANTTKK